MVDEKKLRADAERLADLVEHDKATTAVIEIYDAGPQAPVLATMVMRLLCDRTVKSDVSRDWLVDRAEDKNVFVRELARQASVLEPV